MVEAMVEVRTVGVVGAGQMGCGIAQVAVAAGYEVRMLDRDASLAERGRGSVEAALRRLVERERMSAEDCESALGRLHVERETAALAGADLAIEAVPESLPLKLEVLAAVDAVLGDGAILATNTSSISITRLATASRLPQRVVGMHFMNPAPLMPLVEVIRAAQTDDATVAATCAVAERMGKTVVQTRDSPGFLVNRLLIPFLNEACFALQEGLASGEDLDQALRLGLNHPMGPLALADLIGLDTVLSIAEVLHRDLGEDKYRPAPLLRTYVDAGWLGRKSGRGFFVYE